MVFWKIKKSGYDVQYAAAAVMMFRYYGIPSRYVEGYLLTPETVKEAGTAETVTVSQKVRACMAGNLSGWNGMDSGRSYSQI